MSRLLICISFIGSFMFLAGCAGPQINWSDQNQIESYVTSTRDDFEKMIEFHGPYFEGCKGSPNEDFFSSKLFIRAYKYDKTKSTNYQIYILDKYTGEWHHYDRAYDSDGTEMDFTSISKEVGACGNGLCFLTEHVGLNVTKEYLIAHQDTGIQVKISGNNGKRVCSLPGIYVKAFLTVVK